MIKQKITYNKNYQIKSLKEFNHNDQILSYTKFDEKGNIIYKEEYELNINYVFKQLKDIYMAKEYDLISKIIRLIVYHNNGQIKKAIDSDGNKIEFFYNEDFKQIYFISNGTTHYHPNPI